ncbi:hypothetical protein ACOMHN_061589 [Nucella lapillus]
MEIVTSNKGGAKISYQEFLYTKKATKKTRIRWECSQRKGLSCKSAITTDLNNEDIQDARGEPPRKRVKRSSKDLQTRLKAICTQHRDGVKTLEEALRALGHCIRF